MKGECKTDTVKHKVNKRRMQDGYSQTQDKRKANTDGYKSNIIHSQESYKDNYKTNA